MKRDATKKEKRERESVEGKTKTRGWEGGKKKRRERGEGEVDARPCYRRRAVVTCASDRRPRGGGGGVVVRKRET